MSARTPEICAICLNPLLASSDTSEQKTVETIRRLSCTHIFHANCINPQPQEHLPCPICHEEILRWLQGDDDDDDEHARIDACVRDVFLAALEGSCVAIDHLLGRCTIS